MSSEDRSAEAGVLPKASQQVPELFRKDSLFTCTFPGCTIIMATRMVAPNSLSPTAYLTQDFYFTKTDGLISSNSILH